MSLRTPFEPSRIDPRCSSSLYLPDRTSDSPMSLLVAALAGLGVTVRFDTVAGAGHDLEALTPAMVDFLEGVA